jgi:YidC/Oxa1 family membrane protein insertase
LYYEHEEGKSNYLGLGSQEMMLLKMFPMLYKQHFYFHFVIKYSFEKAELHSTNLVKDDKVDTTFTKQFKAVLPLAFKNGEIDQKMNWYYGPTDYTLLKSYDRNLEDIVAGLGILVGLTVTPSFRCMVS